MTSLTAKDFVTVAQLRAELAGLLAGLDHDAPLYVTQRGQARAVLLHVDGYRALVEQLEYLYDALEALLARERRERGEETLRPLAHVIRERAAPEPRPPKTRTARRAHGRISR